MDEVDKNNLWYLVQVAKNCRGNYYWAENIESDKIDAAVYTLNEILRFATTGYQGSDDRQDALDTIAEMVAPETQPDGIAQDSKTQTST